MIKTDKLTKIYGSAYAVKELNLTVKSGEILCLLGANGAGKSTTINMLLNFVKPSSGNAYIDGMDVQKETIKTKQALTYIPENLMLYPTLSAVENLDYFTKLSNKRFSKKRLEETLSEAGLDASAHHSRVQSFSKGMRQKVGIALAIAKESKVMLLDEPTSGLDPKSSNDFSNLLIKMKENGVAVLMATHDLFRAKDISSHIAIMRDGELQKYAPTAEFDLKNLERLYLDIMNYENA